MSVRLARKYLSGVDRIGETAFAVIMVIIINGYVALSDLNTDFTYIVFVNIGACLGWGLIDGFIYALSSSMERNDRRTKLTRLKSLKENNKALEKIETSLDDTFLATFDNAGKKAIAKDIMTHVGNASLEKNKLITKKEALGGLSIVGIYLTTGFLLALPFLIFPNKLNAWLISNTAGCLWLFWYGTQLGKKAGKYPILIGLLMAAIGVFFLVNSYITWVGFG